jgi:hypothetical protein
MNGPCINHPELPASSKCPKCAHAFCEDCLAFTVNGVRWCELCSNKLADETKPRWPLFWIVLGSGWTLTTVVWIAKRLLVPVPIPLFGYVLTGGYGGSLYLAWHLLSNTAGEPPEIKRRV